MKKQARFIFRRLNVLGCWCSNKNFKIFCLNVQMKWLHKTVKQWSYFTLCLKSLSFYSKIHSLTELCNIAYIKIDQQNFESLKLRFWKFLTEMMLSHLQNNVREEQRFPKQNICCPEKICVCSFGYSLIRVNSNVLQCKFSKLHY